jgi:hypothetical protein
VDTQFSRKDRSRMLPYARTRLHALSISNCLGAMLPYCDCMGARNVVDGKYDAHRGDVVVVGGARVVASEVWELLKV